MIAALRDRFRQDHLLRGSIGLTVYTVCAALMGFAYWVLVARVYDVAVVGAAGVVVGIAPLLSMVAALGMPETVIRSMPGNGNRVRLWRDATLLTGLAAVVIAGVWTITGRGNVVFAPVSGTWHLAGILIAMVGATAVSSVSVATAIAGRRSIWLTMEALGGGAVRLAATAMLADRGLDGLLSGYTIGSLAAATISAAVAAVAARDSTIDVDAGSSADAPGGLQYTQWRYAVSNWIAGMVSMLPKSVIASVVAWRTGVEEAAWVAIPLLILNVITIIPSAVARSLFSEGARDGMMVGRALFVRAVRLAGGATFAAGVVVVISAPWMLRVFGDAYSENATDTMRLFAVAAVLSVPNYLLDAVLNLRRRRHAFMVTNIVGTAMVLVSITVLTSITGLGVAWIVGQVGYFLVGFLAWCVGRNDG